MPELPEVERVRRSVEAAVLGARVERVRLGRRDMLVMPGDPEGGWSRASRDALSKPKRYRASDLLAGGTIERVERHGKQLALVGEQPVGEHAGGEAVVLVHLGMTGQLRAMPNGTRSPGDHVHMTWWLRSRAGEPTGRLIFRDPRRFGGLWSLPTRAALAERWSELGPDALEITGSVLWSRLRARNDQPKRTSIKAALLDQRVLAGVGNIYADEACFRAGIDPRRQAGSLSRAQIDRLAREVRFVLARAVAAGGSTLRDYVDANGTAGEAQLLHAVYGRAGLACVVCGRPLSSDRVAQRATVWCPRCQS